jgi:predicted nucleic acid-binding protein
MIVVDASLIVDVLLVIDVRPDLTDRLLDRSEVLNAPQLMDVEVVQVLRRYARAGWLSASRAEQALDDLAKLPIERYGHSLLIPQIWECRDNLPPTTPPTWRWPTHWHARCSPARRFAGSSICAGRVALV